MMAIASLAGAVVGLSMLRGRRSAAAERARLATD
jgi:hypothetical protein